MFKSKSKNKDVFGYITRGNSSPTGKPKVFLVFHPDDKELATEVASDILNIVDVAIWYPLVNNLSKDDIELIMSMSNLLVMPITNKFLDDEYSLLENSVKCAEAKNISILPVLFDNDVDDRFNQLSGNLHLCVKDNAFGFEKSYDDRLKEYLTQLFISDELVKKVRESFDSYIFLSYRKKDKAQARELMKDIHDDKDLQNIAIWYDEFLCPGEDFNKEIEEALKKSEIFALLVTPNLLESGNYVLKTEYPMAVKAGKEILPTEKLKTSHSELQKKYKNLPCIVDGEDIKTLQSDIKNKLKKLAISITDNPEHNYYVGLAYMQGIDVELNKEKGINILKGSAAAGFVPAMEKLCDIYKFGDGVKMSINEALYWANMVVNAYKVLAKTDSDYKLTLANWLIKAGYLYSCNKEHEKGQAFANEAFDIFDKIKLKDEESFILLFKALDSYGDQLILADKDEQAKLVYENLKAILEDFEFSSDEQRMFYESQVFYKLGNVKLVLKQFDDATHEFVKALEIFRELYKFAPKKYKYFLACVLDNLASLNSSLDKIEEAIVYRKEAEKLFSEMLKDGGEIIKEEYYCCLFSLCDELTSISRSDCIEYNKKLYNLMKERIDLRVEENLVSLARICIRIGLGNVAENKLDLAQKYLEEAFDLIKKEMQKSQTPYFDDIAVVQFSLGRLYYMANNIKKVIYHYDSVIDTICNFCEGRNPENDAVIVECADTLIELSEQVTGVDFTKTIDDAVKYLMAGKDFNFLSDVLRLSHALSQMCVMKGDFNKQVSSLNSALEYSNTFNGKKDENYLDDSLILFSLGLAYSDLQNDKQEEYFLKLFDCYEKHFANNVNGEVYEIATIAGNKLSEFYSKKGDLLKQRLIEQRVKRLLESN